MSWTFHLESFILLLKVLFKGSSWRPGMNGLQPSLGHLGHPWTLSELNSGQPQCPLHCLLKPHSPSDNSRVWGEALRCSPGDFLLFLHFQGAENCSSSKSLQSCPTLCSPIDSSPPGSPVPGILQARTLERVAISFSRVALNSPSIWSFTHV